MQESSNDPLSDLVYAGPSTHLRINRAALRAASRGLQVLGLTGLVWLGAWLLSLAQLPLAQKGPLVFLADEILALIHLAFAAAFLSLAYPVELGRRWAVVMALVVLFLFALPQVGTVLFLLVFRAIMPLPQADGPLFTEIIYLAGQLFLGTLLLAAWSAAWRLESAALSPDA
jgi:hypothetical protein